MDPFTQRNIQPYWKWDQIVENNWKIPLIFMVITKYNHHLNSQILHNYPWLLYQTTWGVCFCMLLKFNQGAVARLAFLYDMAKSSLRHILRPRTFSVPTTLDSNQNSPFFAKLQDFRICGLHCKNIKGNLQRSILFFLWRGLWPPPFWRDQQLIFLKKCDPHIDSDCCHPWWLFVNVATMAMFLTLKPGACALTANLTPKKGDALDPTTVVDGWWAHLIFVGQDHFPK